ncbi:MAG: hypothetical protein LJE63_17370 [Desulfobacteraceae bacterium]|nr:hypothetical protein [Desulfobacteraceae bacterium]
MKILFVLHHAGAFRSFDAVIRHLCAAGHQVTVLYGSKKELSGIDRGLKVCAEDLNGLKVGRLLLRKSFVRLANVRELINCIGYLNPRHPNPQLAKRYGFTVIAPVWNLTRKVMKNACGRRLLGSDFLQKSLKKVERFIPPDRGILNWLRLHAPNIVVASPFIFSVSEELEYVKAAKYLKIPTLVAVLSWDNLTTKGTFHIMPDMTLVWNEALAEEAVRLHDVPRTKIVSTGALPFDFWFEMRPSMDRASFCSHIGVDPDRPILLYLCSSPYIGRDEVPFVLEFARILCGQPKTRPVQLLVRPHPLNAGIWDEVAAENITIWPKKGEFVDVPQAKQDYYNTIYHVVAAIGLNTSAFLETAIVDRPCITIMTERYANKQTGLAHFQHLRDADFLEVARGFSEAAEIVANIIKGEDAKAGQRGRFVNNFIRPRGLDKPAFELTAKAIQATARGEDCRRAVLR